MSCWRRAWGLPGSRSRGRSRAGSLSLNQAIDLALKEQPTVKQSRENVAAARYNIGVARAAYLPQVNFVTNYYYGNAFPTVRPINPGTSATGGSTASIGSTGGDQLSISISFKPTS